MRLITISSPHVYGQLSTDALMQKVLLACLPGLLVLCYYFGWGPLINVVLMSLFSVMFEAFALWLRGRSPMTGLRDYSVLVTAILLGVSLPPLLAWWMLLIGAGFSVLIAKHLYGGLGYNPFNPAMVGYVVLLICFPLEMSSWLTPSNLLTQASLSLSQSLAIVFQTMPLVDSYTSATVLDAFKFREGLTVDEFWQQTPAIGLFSSVSAQWTNIAFLVGGIWLLQQKIYTWHAPVGMLAGLAVMTILFYSGGSSTSGGSLFFHWFSGATMLGAFFIITDPVTSVSGRNARFYYGVGAGVLIYIIRVWGGYPDAVAFAILLMNFAAPFMDQFIKPKVYGHS